MSDPCSFCDRPGADLHLGPLEAHACSGCARRLGHLLTDTPALLSPIWRELRPEDDPTPEPRVRLPDGRSVELRERTADLKKDLPLEKRAELCTLLGEIGLLREQLQEIAFVLSSDSGKQRVQHVLDLLFAPGRTPPDAPDMLRRYLLPS